MRTGLIALVVAAAAGSAQAVVTYGFEAGFAADGWSSTVAPSGLQFLDSFGSNYVNGSANAPIADSDAIGSTLSVPFDIAFTSPAQAAAGPGTLSYEINFQSFSGLDAVDVLYGNTLLFTHNTDTGSLFSAATGVAFSHAINAQAGDKVTFRYYSTDTSAWEWYAQVDNVTIDVIPAPASLALVGLGGLVAGRRRR